MTKFEQFLIDKGYIMFAFNAKEMKYYKHESQRNCNSLGCVDPDNSGQCIYCGKILDNY